MNRGFTHESTAADVSVEWYTPEYLMQQIGGRFDLDPCSPLGGPLPWMPVDARFTLHDGMDGLLEPWFGNVWLNPPYGKHTPHWLKRLHEHGLGMTLVFSRTGSGWFRDYVANSDAILFLSKRVQFVGRDGKPPIATKGKNAGKPQTSPGADSLLAAWGGVNVERLESMHERGLGVLWRISK